MHLKNDFNLKRLKSFFSESLSKCESELILKKRREEKKMKFPAIQKVFMRENCAFELLSLEI
jgi:hypothetical protein